MADTERTPGRRLPRTLFWLLVVACNAVVLVLVILSVRFMLRRDAEERVQAIMLQVQVERLERRIDDLERSRCAPSSEPQKGDFPPWPSHRPSRQPEFEVPTRPEDGPPERR
jgi:hypothetical protein